MTKRSLIAWGCWSSVKGFVLLLSVVWLAGLVQGQSVNPAVFPADRLTEPWWVTRHQKVLAAVQSHPDTPLLLIGDSITNNYDKARQPDEDFLPTWNQFYGARQALNLGFSGDTTANVLWRLDHGEVEGLHPKVALVLIGTNNTGHAKQTAEETETGIDAVVADLERRLPQTKILLLAILPSDLSRAKTERDDAVNHYLAACYGENPHVTYLDVGSIFYRRGELETSIFYDPRLPQHAKALHPDTKGQRMMAEAIEPTLARMMGDQPQQPLASMTDINTALVPVEALEQDSYDWYARHHAEKELGKKIMPEVVLIGDSITHFWSGVPRATHVNGPAAWERLFGKTALLNMGFGWDRTQNVLWRLRQGEFDDLHPRWVILAIGTNNLVGTSHARANTPEEIAEAIGLIYDELRKRSPESRIVVMAVFPRGASPTNSLRKPIQQTNQLLALRFSGDAHAIYLDIGEKFLVADHSLPVSLMPDGTHPSDAGYQLWADALLKAGVRP